MTVTEACPVCEKFRKLCVCDAVSPVDNGVFVLILRHPQEQDKKLGTAKIATLQLKNSLMKTGLSWPNLNKALGRAADQPADPKRWGILFLGAAKDAEPAPDARLTVLTKKGTVAPDQDALLRGLEGIVLLDGNWQQAKALWWRNAWMLKCRRMVLNPPQVSLYGNLRKEPRRESVSTIEAAAYTLAALENDDALVEKILPPFRRLLERVRG